MSSIASSLFDKDGDGFHEILNFPLARKLIEAEKAETLAKEKAKKTTN